METTNEKNKDVMAKRKERKDNGCRPGRDGIKMKGDDDMVEVCGKRAKK